MVERLQCYPESIDGPEDIWEAYISETPAKQRSPQGAMAYAFGALTRASDSYFDMLWRWFTERRGADDMRANALDGGLSADDFKLMLDDHERNIMAPQPATDAQQKRTPFPEPPLTCPAIDAFISKHSPEDEIVKELTAIRDINSQLRFGLWSEQSRADEAEANLDSRSEIIEECARMADGWLAAHGQNEIKYTSARDYACDAVADVADAIRGLAIPSTEGK